MNEVPHYSSNTGTIGQSFYRGSDGCLLVYDVTNEASSVQLLSWRDEALGRVDPDHFFPFVAIGNKTDLRTDANKFDQSQILEWCRANTYGHMEASAKDGTGVEAAMQSIALLALEAKRNYTEVSFRDPESTIRLEDRYSISEKSSCCSN